ncbi:MAG: AMP-binding protein [Burkholderiaceae bacterium]
MRWVARRRWAQVAIVWEDGIGSVGTLRYGELQTQADRLNHALRRLGLQRGQRVAVVMPQRPETAIAHMALYQLGAVAIPLSIRPPWSPRAAWARPGAGRRLHGPGLHESWLSCSGLGGRCPAPGRHFRRRLGPRRQRQLAHAPDVGLGDDAVGARDRGLLHAVLLQSQLVDLAHLLPLVLDIMKAKPGCVITDVARPLDLPADEVAKRPDVLVIESGEIQPTGKVKVKNIGLPPGVVCACLAKTIVLVLEGRFENDTIGRAIGCGREEGGTGARPWRRRRRHPPPRPRRASAARHRVDR